MDFCPKWGIAVFEDDLFVEEMVVRRKSIINLLISAAAVLAALALLALVFLVLPGIMPAMLVILGFGAYLAVKFQYVEYEYSFTNGDFDVDRIQAKRKRKRVLEINQQQIKVMAPYKAEYENETKDYNVTEVKDFSGHKNAAGRWFFIYEKSEGGCAFVVIQPSPKLREAFYKYLRKSRMKGMDA